MTNDLWELRSEALGNGVPLEDFGSALYPLRCSALPLLTACSLRAVMLYRDECLDNAGIAADTGSAVHKAAAAWHRGSDYKQSLNAMKEAIAEYPLADFHEAELHFRPYSEDPRNKETEIIAVEHPVKLEIPCAEDDPTKKAILIRGTLDQIRVRDGLWYVDDIKTGKRIDGWAMLHSHALQMAAYALAATATFKREVLPGAFIRTYGYRVRNAPPANTAPGGVFFHTPWGLAEAELLLDSIRHKVSLIRRGLVTAGPGDHCSYCPANGLDNCLPVLQQLRKRGS